MSAHVPARLRDQVQQRADGRCEYCLIHEDDVLLSHEPDHIIACKHGGQTIYENIAWACFLCNRFKGSDIASVDPENQDIVRLFQPRVDDWRGHFTIDRGRIVGLTPQGRATVFVLQMNRQECVETRRHLTTAGRYPG